MNYIEKLQLNPETAYLLLKNLNGISEYQNVACKLQDKAMIEAVNRLYDMTKDLRDQLVVEMMKGVEL